MATGHGLSPDEDFSQFFWCLSSAGQLGPGLQLAGQDVAAGQSATYEPIRKQLQCPSQCLTSSSSPGTPGVTVQLGLGLSREPRIQVLWTAHQGESTLPHLLPGSSHLSFSLSLSMSRNQAPNSSLMLRL